MLIVAQLLLAHVLLSTALLTLLAALLRSKQIRKA
jgi:hypothetical protein